MEISKSMVCRFGITVGATAAIVALFWYAIAVLPSIIPDTLFNISWLVIALIVLLTIVYAFFACTILIVWSESPLGSLCIGLLVGGLVFFLGVLEPERSLERGFVMILSLGIIIEIVALVVHEYIAKKACKMIFGGNHE